MCLFPKILMVKVKIIKRTKVMKLLTVRNSQIKLINKIILYKLLTNMMDYLQAKFEPKIFKNKGAFKF